MPTDYRIVKSTTYQTNFESESPAILNFIKNNPGSTISEIATGTSRTDGEIRDITQLMEIMGLVINATGENDISVIWHVSDWANALETNIQDARNWLDTNNNQLISKMATDLSIPWEIAERLGWLLEYEDSGHRVSV